MPVHGPDSWPGDSPLRGNEVSIYISTYNLSTYLRISISTYLLTKVTGSLCPAEQCRDTAQQLELTQRRVESVQEKVTVTINIIDINIAIIVMFKFIHSSSR